MDTHAEKP